MKRNQAETVAELFGNDGQQFVDTRGRTIREVCIASGATMTVHENRQVFRYEFSDGSAIVECVGGWDLRAEGCPNICWAGVGPCTCGVGEGER